MKAKLALLSALILFISCSTQKAIIKPQKQVNWVNVAILVAGVIVIKSIKFKTQ